MKRVLSVIIASVLMLCLSVTAFAAGTYNEYPEIELTLGEAEYTLSGEYDYTILSFVPTETGKYTLDAGESLIGIVSYNGMWVSPEPSETVVSSSSLVWECTGVGQSIWVAVKGGADSTTISVTSEELIDNTLPWTIYENEAEVTKFTYDGDFANLIYVETFDEVVNTAVKCDDGFYRLDSANGPVLYVNLMEELMPLIDKDGYAVPLKAAFYEGDTVVEKIDFNNAFEEYRTNAHNNKNAGFLLYPLTEDLIEIYQKVGEANAWYGEEGWVGGDVEDAWMFACYYDETYVVPDEEVSDDESSDEASTEDESDTTYSDDESVTAESESDESASDSSATTPATGDASSMTVFVLLAVVAVLGSAIVIKSRK